MIITKKHRRALIEMSEKEQPNFAEAIAEVTRKYDRLFDTSFPYSKHRPHSVRS
jgi:UDPglucose--hexose-1-phosphate uridylyltransferase